MIIGDTGIGFLIKKILNMLLHRTPADIAHTQLRNIALAKGDIVIDAGANVGEVSKYFCESGAEVYAFEPNPYAFKKLSERFADKPNVHCVEQGVAEKSGTMKLYLHEYSSKDEIYWSTGSSLLSGKSNVLEDKYVEVEVIDLCQFIKNLCRRVRILKMDVEGAECGILKRIIHEGLVDRIDHLFIETHEEQIPELKEATDEIRNLIEKRGIKNINLNWL